MRAKDMLNEVRILDTRINIITRHIDDLRSKMASVGSVMGGGERVQTSPASDDRLTDILAKIDEEEEKANSLIDEYVNKKSIAVRYVSSLDNENYIKLLTLRYFENKSFIDIADELAYSYRHVTKMHGWALLELEKTIKKA